MVAQVCNLKKENEELRAMLASKKSLSGSRPPSHLSQYSTISKRVGSTKPSALKRKHSAGSPRQKPDRSSLANLDTAFLSQ